MPLFVRTFSLTLGCGLVVVGLGLATVTLATLTGGEISVLGLRFGGDEPSPVIPANAVAGVAQGVMIAAFGAIMMKGGIFLAGVLGNQRDGKWEDEWEARRYELPRPPISRFLVTAAGIAVVVTLLVVGFEWIAGLIVAGFVLNALLGGRKPDEQASEDETGA